MHAAIDALQNPDFDHLQMQMSNFDSGEMQQQQQNGPPPPPPPYMFDGGQAGGGMTNGHMSMNGGDEGLSDLL